jgi:hypothetical protein
MAGKTACHTGSGSALSTAGNVETAVARSLLLDRFLSLQVGVLGFRSGVILIVTGYGFRDLFRRELTVILRMQNFG